MSKTISFGPPKGAGITTWRTCLGGGRNHRNKNYQNGLGLVRSIDGGGVHLAFIETKIVGIVQNVDVRARSLGENCEVTVLEARERMWHLYWA